MKVYREKEKREMEYNLSPLSPCHALELGTCSQGRTETSLTPHTLKGGGSTIINVLQ